MTVYLLCVVFASSIEVNLIDIQDNNYRPQTKFAKVMFLQVSVCPQGGMRGCSWGVGCAWLLPGGHAWLLWGGMHGEGGCAWWRVACVAKGGVRGEGRHAWWRGVCGEGGHAWQKGACMAKGGGACMVCTASHCAGGTHPTGMHSCFIKRLPCNMRCYRTVVTQ